MSYKIFITGIEIYDDVMEDVIAKFEQCDECYNVRIDYILSSEELKKVVQVLEYLENINGEISLEKEE